MVPGGIAHTVDIGDLVLCRHQLGQFRDWYERHILGCPLERWLAVGSAAELEGWLEDSDRHRQSELGFFLRWAKLAGLDRVGQGVGRFLSYGSLELPAGSAVTGSDGQWVAAGFVDALGLHPFDQREIAESTASSWYQATNGEALHPFAGETRPGVPTDDDGRYSWAKAPRYRDQPAETGPLAERMVASDPLFTDLVRRGGASAMTRQLARMVRPARVIPVMETWLAELMAEPDAPCYQPPPALETGRGCGLIQAARGALGHWVEIEDRQITRYQVITPSAWNGSPRDGSGQRGPWEQALIGLAVADPDDPVLLGSVVRSFDPCLVCTVHTLVRGRRPGRLRLA
jgi:hydrogenase large subunit